VLEVLILGFISLFPLTLFGLISGFLMPRNYSVVRKKLLPVPASEVWTTIYDFAGYPIWLSYVSEMECESIGDKIWLQRGSIVPIRFQVTHVNSGKQLKTVMLPGAVPLMGSRTFTLMALDAQNSELTLLHEGAIANPLLRSYLFFFHRWRDPAQLFMDNLHQYLTKRSQ
jgi:hypothetical protein